ncbi:hypothetical protein LAZ67_15000588, partial [Cordylochernes scorpioides]
MDCPCLDTLLIVFKPFESSAGQLEANADETKTFIPLVVLRHTSVLFQPARPKSSSPPPPCGKKSTNFDLQNKCSINLRTIENYANSPAGGKDANSATSFDFAIDTPFNGAIKAQRSWADSSKDVNPASEDGFTVVQGKKRRRGSAESPVTAAHSSHARRSGSNRRQRSSTERVPRAQEIKTTRTHIVEARARQASSTEEQCLYVEHCPEFEPYHYLKAIDEMVGGTSDVVQVTKMNGHCLLGLANKALEERLINEGLEVEGMLLKTFPFYRRAAKITIGNLPFFVKDASVIDALLPYGRVTSIVPKQLKAGKYVYTDGRREAFIVPHDGINIESIPARLDIRIKGESWPMYLTSGIRCSRCRGQGHRRAKCPMLTGQSTGPRRASPPSTTNVPQVTAPELPRQASAASPAPPPPDPAMEVSGVLPAAPAAPHQPAVLGQPPPAPMALPMDISTPVPAPPAPSREKPSNSPTAHTAPQPAESTPPTPHREESTPDFVTYTPPLPPPLTKEEQEALEFQCEAQLCDLLEKLNWEQALEPLFEDGMEENDVPFAVIWPECREQLLPYVSRRHKPILAEFLGTVAEHARDCHPIIQKGLSEDRVELKEMAVKKEEATQVGNYFVQHLPRNPSMFSGEDGEDPLTWLKGYNRVAKYNHWDETLCLANVYFYLNGTALKWFENNEETIRNWGEFTTQLESVFGKSESLRLLAEKKLKIRAQLKGESTEFYMQDVLRLCKEVDLQMSEDDKISHLMKGIVEELYQALLPKDINNTDQFVSECRRIEALHRRRVTPAKYERLPNVASLDVCNDNTDLSSMIRQIVREEVQRALAAPREEPRIATIEDMVREEIDKTLAPITNPSRGSPKYRTYTPSPIARRETAAPPDSPSQSSVPETGRKTGHKEFLVEDTPRNNSPLYAEREYRIEPASCQLIEVLSRDISDNATVVAESQRGLSLERELMAPSSIISLTSNRGKLWVANWSPYPKIIPQGMHVADGVVIEDSRLCVLAEGNHVGTDIGHSGDSSIAEILNIDDSLDDFQKEKLRNLLRNYRDIFDFRKKEASKTDNVKHRISTGDHLPTKQRPYRVAPAERQIIQEEVNKMEEIGIIQPSASPWASPVVLVRKKDGSWRFCVDYRRLNKITKKDVYPLPRIDDTLDCLQGARFYSSMDLQSGYWQIDLEESDREKTAFITPDGLYEFKVMPFGLCNAPATFERMMDGLLKGLRWTICLCYLDDIVVFSDDFEEHLRRLQLVLGCLRKAGLCLNPGKCRFGAKTITVLGHKKDSVFSWNIEERHAFEALKSALISEPVLGHFDHSSPTEIHTDASNYGIGAVLVQIQKGKERAIAYASRTLNKAERNYSTTERECLAVIWAIGKFRPYVFGRQFTIVTDHHSLCWLANLKDPCGRLARWALRLQEFDVTVVHKSGRKHQDADCLSRSPLNCSEDIEEDIPCIVALQNFGREQMKDPDLTKIADKIQQETSNKSFIKINDTLHKKNYDPMGREWLLVVPRHLRPEILRNLHDSPTSGHLGFTKTYDRIRKKFYWPGMYRNVRKYVAHCPDCQRRKRQPQLPPGLLQPIPVPIAAFEKVGMDLLGRFPTSMCGNRWIIVCTDYLTKFAITKALPTSESVEVAKFFIKDVILKHGAPREVITDRGRNFTSSMIRELNKHCRIIHRTTTAYHPQTNGLTERLNKTIADMLSMYVDVNQKDWDEILPFVTFAYNTAKQESTGFKDEDDFIQTLGSRAEEARQLARIHTMRSQGENKLRYDAHHRNIVYQPGDLVWIYIPVRKVGLSEKLMRRYFGPYRVTRKISDVTYEVETFGDQHGRRKTKDIVHICRMKPYLDPEEREDHLEEDMEDNSSSPQGEEVSVEGRRPPLAQEEVPRPGDLDIPGPVTRAFNLASVVLAESPGCTEQVPERSSILLQTGEELSPKEGNMKKTIDISSENQKNANSPAGDMHVNPAAARGDVTAPKTAATTSATPASPASLNWAYSEMAEVDANDGYTVVKSKKRRLTSTPEHAARQPGRPAEKPSLQQRKRSTGPRAVPPREIKATRANIADARARQATTNHENYVFVELCPDIPDYSYLKAISTLLGGPKSMTQFHRMNGHFIVGLADKELANRLDAEGLEIEGTSLRVFPFRKRAERIVVADLPGFVEDSTIVNTLGQFGKVTSIAPILVKMGEFTFTDGRREAFILLREGVRLETLPTRLTIHSKGDTLSAFLSFGIKCSKCGKQGHRRANCPALAKQGNGNPRQAASPTDARPPPPPQQPRKPAPAPATPASPVQPAKTSGFLKRSTILSMVEHLKMMRCRSM